VPVVTVAIAFWLALFSPPSERQIDVLLATAPQYLTREAARHHLIAARAAGASHRVPPELLLAIAWHESRYIPTTRTAELRGRVSCGVMTPVPQRGCTAFELSLLGGYDAGARHLRAWLDLCHGGWSCALLAYAGGGGLVRACQHGPWWTPRGSNACEFAIAMSQRAQWLRGAVR
jgi:hypothetical protein